MIRIESLYDEDWGRSELNVYDGDKVIYSVFIDPMCPEDHTMSRLGLVHKMIDLLDHFNIDHEDVAYGELD